MQKIVQYAPIFFQIYQLLMLFAIYLSVYMSPIHRYTSLLAKQRTKTFPPMCSLH